MSKRNHEATAISAFCSGSAVELSFPTPAPEGFLCFPCLLSFFAFTVTVEGVVVFGGAAFVFAFGFAWVSVSVLVSVLFGNFVSSSAVVLGSLLFLLVSDVVSPGVVVSAVFWPSSCTATGSSAWSGFGRAGTAQVTMFHETPVKDLIGRVLFVHRRHWDPDRSRFLDVVYDSPGLPAGFG